MKQQAIDMAGMTQLLELMAKLRDPEHGCQWDRKQTMSSLIGHTLEEVYEVVDAVEQGDPEQIRDELGDLLFQIVFYARIAQENDQFRFDDVARQVFSKLLQRHPHVFPDGTLESFGSESAAATDPQEVERNWEAIKNANRKEAGGEGSSVLDDVPRALPAMARARKLQKRAASKGFDWTEARQVLAKLDEEIEELEQAMLAEDKQAVSAEFGDLLFSCINLSRHLRVDPEQALRESNARFEQRFRHVESRAGQSGGDLQDHNPEQLELWWEEAKRLGVT